jgi:hypothetical protein
MNIKTEKMTEVGRGNWLAKAAVYAAAIAAILGSILAAGIKIIEIQKLFPDFYYGFAADSCSDHSGYGVALRSANLPMIRCYIEKQGLSAARELPKGDLHAQHYPLALVAEACNYKAARYLVLLRGADPRYGHIYFDPNRPPGPSNDTPRAIAFSHCRDKKDGNMTPNGKDVVAFLDEEAAKIAPNEMQ